MIEINKSCILFFQQALSQLGFDGCSAGLSIIVWAAFLKILTTPAYENSLKYPAQMEKAVQDVIEDQLKRNNPEAYTFENDHKEIDQTWTNPIKAQLAPHFYRFGVALPLFVVEAQALLQLVRERPEFQQPFGFIPQLSGPSQEFGLTWL